MQNQDFFSVSLDSGAIIKDFNNKASEISGYSKHEVIGKNWFEIFIPESDILVVLEVFSNLFHGNNSQWEFVNEITCKNGDIKTLKWVNSIIRDENGRPELISSVGKLTQ